MRHTLFLVIALLLTAPMAAPADDIVSTILIAGLRHVDRDVLLDDLGVHEGDRVGGNLERGLSARARELPYLSTFRIEVERLGDGLHLNMRVAERPRFQLAPIIGTLDDGDLVGGMRLRSYSLLRRGESWDAIVLAGPMADLGLRMNGLPIAGPVSFAFDLRLIDWENPFFGAEERRWHSLAGLQFRLPKAGRLRLLAGHEGVSTRPYSGIPSAEGEDRHALFTGRLRQPLGFAGLALTARGQLRTPSESQGFLQAEAGIDHRLDAGRWFFHTRLLQGGATWNSPPLARPFLSNWRYLHAYDAGELETRDFGLIEWRGDIRLFHLPMRMSRRGPERHAPVTAFFLAAASRHRMDPATDWGYAGEGGCGIALRVPDYDLRLSVGGFVTREGETRMLIMLEDVLP